MSKSFEARPKEKCISMHQTMYRGGTRRGSQDLRHEHPLIVRKCRTDSSWGAMKRKVLSFNPDFNEDAWPLNTIADVKNEVLFGFPNINEWDLTPVGDILIVRTDQRDITPEQAELLVAFHRFEVHPGIAPIGETFMHMEGKELEDFRLETVKACTNKINFTKFFKKFLKDKVDKGEEAWARVTSPFDVSST